MAQAPQDPEDFDDDLGILAKKRIGELRAAAGPRGYTFMGRVVKDPTEDPRETLKRTPLGELEAGSLARTGVSDLSALIGLGKMSAAAGTVVGHDPRAFAKAAFETAKEAPGFIKSVPGRWRDFWQNIGENISTQMPTYFRAGRGTPIAAREAKFQMEADIANRMESAVALGKNLQRNFTLPERLRADQMLRGSFNPVEESLMREARGRVKWTPDAQAYSRELSTAADEILAEKIRTGNVTYQTLKNGQVVSPEKLYAAVRPARKLMDEIEQELLSLGRLSPEIVERFHENFGPYLARLYESKQFRARPLTFATPKPVRAGTERLLPRGERVEVEIPNLQEEMKRFARTVGPEREFRREYRARAGELAKRREVAETISEREEVLGETRKTETITSREEGAYGKVPLSGVAKRLEDVVTNALEARGMSGPEAAAAVGRVKAAAVKAAQAGPEVEISGGVIRETTRETVERTTRQTREAVREVIENLGINKGQQAALHAYYDVISRGGARAKSIKVGDRTYKISPVMDVESAAERVEALGPLLKEGFRVEKREGGKVTLFRDIPEEIRTAPAGKNVVVGGRPITPEQAEQIIATSIGKGEPPIHKDWRGNLYYGGKVHEGMGEMRGEVGYTVGKSIGQAGREAAVVKYFKTIADNPEWASDELVKGWTPMAKDPKRLANLSGKYVRPDIAAEINDAIKIKSDLQKGYDKILTLWKIGKVTNPGTMFRNFYSSGILADWGGLSFFRPSGIRAYGQTIGGLLGTDKQGAQYLAEAKQLGLRNAGYNQAELEALAKGYMGSKEDNAFLRMLDGMKYMVDKSGAGTAYGSIDNFYKSALYIHARTTMKLNPQMAARHARKYGIDYSDVSPFIRHARQLPLGAPFITFASKAIPLAIETAIKHPVRFWKYPAIVLGLNELSYRSFGPDRDETEKVSELGRLRSPRYLLLPGRGEEGRFRWLDLGYILPFGDILEALDKLWGGAGDANISFEPMGGVIQPLVEIGFNQKLHGSRYTKNPIWNEQDSWPEMLAKISDHLGKSLAPAWAPPVPPTGFRGGYSTEAFRKAIPRTLPSGEKEVPELIGETPMPTADFYGRTRGLGATIASKIFGIDIKEIGLNDVYRAGMIHMTAVQDELAKAQGRIARASISERQRDEQLQNLEEHYRKLEQQIRKEFGLKEEDKNKARRIRGRQGFIDDMGIFK